MPEGKGHRPKAVVSWSSGKDSAWALVRARRDYEVVAALTTLSEPDARVAMHGVRREIMRAQAAALGLPLIEVPIPSPCPNAVYEARMAAAMREVEGWGARTLIFGDLFLEDIAAYRRAKLEPLGVEAVFPLWGRDTAQLAREMIDGGLRAKVVCVDPRRLDASFVGREFDAEFQRDLPADVDPCGENGEFHTCVYESPDFDRPLVLLPGAVSTRDGFVFADFALGEA